MKKTKIRYLLLAVLTLVLSVSCRTSRIWADNEYMHIMVYDLNNSPVSGMVFYMDDKAIGQTDVYGRMTLNLGLKYDQDLHYIKGVKETYSDVETTLVKQPAGVLYFKTGTVQMYLDAAEICIDRGEYNQALDYIGTAEEMESGDDVIYLKSIVLKKAGMEEIDTRLIEKIESENL